MSMTVAVALAIATWVGGSVASATAATPSGSLLIVGGALRTDNAPVYHKLIELAGGVEQAKIAIVPTASSSLSSSKRMEADLESYGLKPEQAYIVDITSKNAATQASNPEVVAQLRGSSGVWFVGGDQLRITKAFLKPDGSDTPAMAAVRAVYQQGGVISGSSAGAAIMSRDMLSAYGIPMDTLDFGQAAQAAQRGVYVSQGLGFFTAGIIDQHFNTYNGRHARLARVLVERRVPLGFGIDENTAIAVTGNRVDVIGASGLTILDASGAKLTDSPLGVSIQGVKLNYLESGDAYDLTTGTYTINAKKQAIAKGDEYENGNRLITDLGQTNAFNRAITYGLVDNTADKQVGLLLRYNQHYGYGYQFTFSKTADTEGYYGNVNGIDSYAARNVQMDIVPVTNDLTPSTATRPSDLAAVKAQDAVQAVVFRGLMRTNDQNQFQPNQPVTRAELANLIVTATAATLKPSAVQPATDVAADHPLAHDIKIAVSRGFLTLADGTFRPDEAVTREAMAVVLKRAYDYYQFTTLAHDPIAFHDVAHISPAARPFVDAAVGAGLLHAEQNHFRPHQAVTREETAVAACRLLGLPW